MRRIRFFFHLPRIWRRKREQQQQKRSKMGGQVDRQTCEASEACMGRGSKSFTHTHHTHTPKPTPHARTLLRKGGCWKRVVQKVKGIKRRMGTSTRKQKREREKKNHTTRRALSRAIHQCMRCRDYFLWQNSWPKWYSVANHTVFARATQHATRVLLLPKQCPTTKSNSRDPTPAHKLT